MSKLRIKTENGGMTINIDNFFPCSQARFNKLFKIVRQFLWLNNVQTITEQLNKNFTDRINEAEDIELIHTTQYFNDMQCHAEYSYIVESGKHLNGTLLTKEELKDFKKKQSSAMSSANSCLVKIKKVNREITALKKNLEMLGNLEM